MTNAPCSLFTAHSKNKTGAPNRVMMFRSLDVNEPTPTRPFFLLGPTGSGKSALALELARLTGGEIVNADAFQLYRGLPVLTACPAPEDRSACPHHLYEVLSPAETCDAGRYLALVRPILAELQARNRLPIVVGGSGLYVKALTHGLAEAPASDPALRRHLDQLSAGELRLLLGRLDPTSADAIEPNNRRYVQRAVEICLLAGRPASSLREAWTTDPPGLRGCLLNRPREELTERIDRRTRAMIAGGAVAEVAAVTLWSTTSERAIGVREIQSLLRGAIDEETCVGAIQLATRRYAKRQLTWFRREDWLTPREAGTPAKAIAAAAGLL